MEKKSEKCLTILFLIIAGSLLSAGCSKQFSPGVYRVGILFESSSVGTAADGFMEKMTELGYIKGKNIVYDMQISDSGPAQNRQIAEKFVQDKVDLIFAFPLMAALSAKAAANGTEIPVIFTICGLEDNNLVHSVREPGGNITGVRSPIIELPIKSYEIMLKLLPHMKRLYTAYAANYPAVLPGLKALRTITAAEGVTLVEAPVTSLEELKADLQARDAAGNGGMNAIILLPETLVQTQEGLAILNAFAVKHNVPVGGLVPWEVQQGAVYTSGIDMYEMGQLAAPLAVKVLKGTKAGTIPVVSPELHLHFNYKRAQELGLTVPEGLLLQAVEIIR